MAGGSLGFRLLVPSYEDERSEQSAYKEHINRVNGYLERPRLDGKQVSDVACEEK